MSVPAWGAVWRSHISPEPARSGAVSEDAGSLPCAAMSRRRLAIGGVVVALALAGLALAYLLTRDEPLTDVDVTDEDIAALEAAECPPSYEVLRAGTFGRAQIAAAETGRFAINGERVELAPPVDWTMNPQQARSFSHTLWKFQWIDPLIYDYRENGNVDALQQAVDLTVDFAEANPPDGDPVDPDVWDDKRTGDRGPYLAYILRAADCEGLLDASRRELLLALMERHANVLTDPEVYKPTNHGLFVDLGLTLLARQLDSQPDAEAWGDLARERFAETLKATIVPDEGFWLEHSAGYQILLARTVQRFLEIPGNDSEELRSILARMEDVTGWLREPDGRIPQFGDSDLKTVPEFGVRRAANDNGVLELDESGLAVVKNPGAYLAVMASYFSDKHKHADALTFDLFDRGRRLITDTGLYAKDKDENFAFAHATRAHSVLTVDGEEFPRDGSGTYGSGIEQTGKGHGVYAVLGTNPAVADQGVDHERLFVYAPHRYLVIVDRLRAGEEHRYARFLQFAPGVDVKPAKGGGLELSAPGFRGAVTTNGAGGERIELAKGEMDPLRGLTSPSFRRWVPRTTARLRSKGSDLDQITTMTLDGEPLETKLVSWDEKGIRLELTREGKPYERLFVHEVDDDFEIDVVR
jgi:hypothetical protein